MSQHDHMRWPSLVSIGRVSNARRSTHACHVDRCLCGAYKVQHVVNWFSLIVAIPEQKTNLLSIGWSLGALSRTARSSQPFVPSVACVANSILGLALSCVPSIVLIQCTCSDVNGEAPGCFSWSARNASGSTCATVQRPTLNRHLDLVEIQRTN